MAQIIAHRGASKKAPQNTLSAFRLAREMKCDGFEFDLHLTKDGYVVICHNYDIDETSNGSGLIREMNYEKLRSYDFGSYFNEIFRGEKIPSLDEVLEISKGLDILDIEIKPPLDENLEIVEKTLMHVEKSGLIDKLLVSSFSDEVLLEVKRLRKSVPTGLLYDPNSEIIDKIFDNPFRFAKGLGCDALHPVYFYVDEDYIQEAHENGLTVNAWTCNKENVINTLIEFDCDGIITDVPDLAFRLNKEMSENT